MTPTQMRNVVVDIQARHNPREAGLADFCRQLIGRIEALEFQLSEEKAACARYAASLAQVGDTDTYKKFIELGCDVVKEARCFADIPIATDLRDAVFYWDEHRRKTEAAYCDPPKV